MCETNGTSGANGTTTGSNGVCLCCPCIGVPYHLIDDPTRRNHTLPDAHISSSQGANFRSNPYQPVGDFLSNVDKFKIIESTLRGPYPATMPS
jgi:hypothetical protein